jgi:hypothetical protein
MKKTFLTEEVFNECAIIAASKQINFFYANCEKIPNLMNSSFDSSEEIVVTKYGLAKFISKVMANNIQNKASQPSDIGNAVWTHIQKINLKIKE